MDLYAIFAQVWVWHPPKLWNYLQSAERVHIRRRTGLILDLWLPAIIVPLLNNSHNVQDTIRPTALIGKKHANFLKPFTRMNSHWCKTINRIDCYWFPTVQMATVSRRSLYSVLPFLWANRHPTSPFSLLFCHCTFETRIPRCIGHPHP